MPRRRVRTAPAAAKALAQARAYLTQPGSGERGRARWDELRQCKRELRTFPYLGPADDDHKGRRRIVVGEYRMIYRVTPDTGDSETAGDVEIVAVFGPGQP